MVLINWILLLAVLGMAGCRIVVPAGRWLWRSLGAVCVLAVIQVLIAGFYWHFLPCYLLIVALVVSAAKLPAKPPVWLIWLARTGLATAMILAIAPLAVFVPVPVLPTPSGPYAVGTEIYRWVDVSRDEPATDNPIDKRNMIAQAWYPAKAPGAERSIYMDGLASLPVKIGLLSDLVMGSYDRINTHATLNADISNQKLWPVVIFSPGFGGTRAWYTGLVTELASLGYVVIALDHPYESTITELADGTIAKRIDTSPRDIDAREPWMATQLDVRAADFQFTLDRIVEGVSGLKGHVDLSRVAAVGHSFGGATAVAATARDPRIGAVVNIDGTLYGEVPVLHRPFLLLQSDYTVTRHGDSFMVRSKQLIEQTSAPAWKYEILGANHIVFMDVLLCLAPPVKWALSKKFGGNLFGGYRKPMEMQHTAADIIDAFIRETLLGESGLVTLTVARYSGIEGGLQVRPKK